MDDKKERNLTIPKRTEDVEKQAEKPVKAHHTNPLMKKLMTFHLEKAAKLTVKDIFKK